MKHLIRNALVAVMGVGVAGLVGCEWGGGGEDNSWNDSNSIANFNGSYQAASGYLVSEYTASSSSGGTVYETASESDGSTGVDVVHLDGECDSTPIRPDSLTIVLTSGSSTLGTFSDDGNGNLNGKYVQSSAASVEQDASGHIDYSTGVWTLDLTSGVALMENAAITLTYQYSAGGSAGGSAGDPGNSGVAIYAFNVQQTGNKLKIVDNNGSVYEGSFGDIRTTGNLGSASGGAEFVNGDQVIGSFSASGTSAAGVHVNMTGTFQGTAAGVSKVTTKSGDSVSYTISMALSDRRIMGTWIEDGGKTGNINGISPSAVNVTYAGNSSTNAVP